MLTEVLLSGLVILCSFTLEAITGFGCTVMALPFITALLGMHDGVIIITVLALLLSSWIVMRNWRSINFKEFLKIAGLMILGLPIGMYLSRTADTELLKTILGVFIITVSAFQLILISINSKRKAQDTSNKVHWYHYIALFAAGIVHGTFSSGGPLAILYTARAIPEKKQFRATLCLLWTTLNIIIVATYLIEGAITASMGIRMAELLPFMAGGIIIGEKIHSHVNANIFTILVFISLLATGVFMLV